MPDPHPHLATSPSRDCFALLDDSDPNAAAESHPQSRPRSPLHSRLYTGHVGTLSCRHASELGAVLDHMQQALRDGRHAVGLFAYELGEQLQGIAPRGEQQHVAPEVTQILLFDRCERLSAADVERWLEQRTQLENGDAVGDTAGNTSERPAGIAAVRDSVSEAEFRTAIGRIRAYIEAGHTYQTNYTYRVRFDAFGPLHALYRRLRTRQPVPYGALIRLPDGSAVLSLSPELFMRHAEGEVTVRPMKGTAAATGDPQQDAVRAQALAADPKNRAENLMIVDLLRNDLGRVAQPGSVQVPHLFEVNRYSSVLQMTSTVRARLREDVGLTELIKALYPCGSVTGAPKRRTMQIIRELESAPRGLYTGAIGWFDPADDREPNPVGANLIGNFCLSVPIRTLVLQTPGPDGTRRGEMGVGAGIVYDSEAGDEYAECRLKASFLTALPNEFELFETMHAVRANSADGCRHLDLHLQRLASSAAYFGFAFDEQQVRTALAQTCAALADGEYRLRLSVNRHGVTKLQTALLHPLATPVRLLPARETTTANDLFLRHKSSVRSRYDTAWRAAEAQGAFDSLFCNERGEVTEGGRSNLFVKLAGHWFTPPLSAGVLPGVMRSVLLADPAWEAAERTLTLDDVRQAEEIVVCNALRGALPATVEWA